MRIVESGCLDIQKRSVSISEVSEHNPAKVVGRDGFLWRVLNLESRCDRSLPLCVIAVNYTLSYAWASTLQSQPFLEIYIITYTFNHYILGFSNIVGQ